MYISPVDLLGLSLDQLMNLDSRGIIRLEKTLKIQRLRSGANAYNPEQVSSIIKQLSNEEQKKSVYFVEKHRYLKEFITTGNDSGEKTFVIDAVLIAKTPNIKEFLEPYFEAYFMKMVKTDFAAKKYDTIIKAMQHKELFTDYLLSTYYRYIKSQADIITEKVKISSNGDLISRCPEVTYKTYIHLLNTVSLGVITKSKADYVNAMIDYYNITKNAYQEFPRVQRAFRNFKLIEVANQETKDFYIKVANHVGSQHWASQQQQHTSTRRDTKKSKGSSFSNLKAIGIVIGIMIFLVRVGRIFTSSSSSSTNYSTYSSPNYKIPTLEFSYEDDKTAFYSDLIHKAENDSLDINNKIIIKSGTTPYAASFKSNEGLRSGDFIKVLNKRTRPFILFEHFNVIKPDYAAYTRPNDSFKIMNKNYLEELVFYMGDDFVGNESLKRETYGSSTKLSASKKYFKSVNEKELSFLKNKYIIDSLGTDPNIVVYDDDIVFTDVFYHLEPHKILPPEVEEVEEAIIMDSEPHRYYEEPSETVSRKNKAPFFVNLFKGEDVSTVKWSLKNLKTGANPFPKIFKSIRSNSITGYEVVVNNTSAEDVILFGVNTALSRDQSTYIKKNTSVILNLHDEDDTLYIYMGSYFYQHKDFDVNSTINSPNGFFKNSSKIGKDLSKKSFTITYLGVNPKINITPFGVTLVDIEYDENKS